MMLVSIIFSGKVSVLEIMDELSRAGFYTQLNESPHRVSRPTIPMTALAFVCDP